MYCKYLYLLASLVYCYIPLPSKQRKCKRNWNWLLLCLDSWNFITVTQVQYLGGILRCFGARCSVYPSPARSLTWLLGRSIEPRPSEKSKHCLSLNIQHQFEHFPAVAPKHQMVLAEVTQNKNTLLQVSVSGNVYANKLDHQNQDALYCLGPNIVQRNDEMETTLKYDAQYSSQSTSTSNPKTEKRK